MYRVCMAYWIPPPVFRLVLANARTHTHAHKCASTDSRYALMQTPALRMPQERVATELSAMRSFKLRNSTSSTRSPPPTLSVANSRYSLSLSLSLFHSSVISFLLHLHLPSLHRLFANASYFILLTYCILISFFFSLARLAAYFSSPKRVRSTRLFSSHRCSLVSSSPSVVFCSYHRSPSSSRMSFDHVDVSAVRNFHRNFTSCVSPSNAD